MRMINNLNTTQLQFATVVGIVTILIASVVAILVPAGLGWDFANFYDAGHKALLGQHSDIYDPDALIAGAAPQGNMRFVSAPITSYLYAPLSLFSPPVALFVFKIQNTLALWIALAFLYFHTRRFAGHTTRQQQLFKLTFVLLVILFQPFWTIYRVGGQVTPTVLLLFSVGLIFQVNSRPVPSALCIVLAVLIKPVFAPGLILLGLISGRRFFTAGISFGFLLGAFSLLTMGWEIHFKFIETVLEQGGRIQPSIYNSSLYSWLPPLWVSPEDISNYVRIPAFLATQILVMQAAVVALIVWIYFGARRLDWPHAARQQFNYHLSLIFALLFAPIVWAHYLSILFIALSYWVAVRRYLNKIAVYLLGLIFLFSIGQNLIFIIWINTHIHIDTALKMVLMGLFKGVPLLLTVVLLVKYRQEIYASYSDQEWSQYQLSDSI